MIHSRTTFLLDPCLIRRGTECAPVPNHGFTCDELANGVWSVLGHSFLKYVFMLRIADNESALVSGGNDEFKALRAGRGGDK